MEHLSNLQQRLIVGSFGVMLLLPLVAISHHPLFKWLFFFAISAVIIAALKEYYTIARGRDCRPLYKFGLTGSFLFLLALFLSSQDIIHWAWPTVVLWGMFVSAFLYYFSRDVDPFYNLAVTVFGVMYLTVPLGCLIAINYAGVEYNVFDGRWTLLYLIMLTKITDIGAFFVGKLFGKHKMSPYISPKKTWEGAAGGLLSALTLSIGFYFFFHYQFVIPPFPLSLNQSIWLGLLISITAQFGDLTESLLKRSVGVKDSSHVPGLGGMLDTADSLIFTAPLMYLYLLLCCGN